MLSVILPSYRNPAYLDLCLQSLVTGQRDENEIIVVLDGYPEESQAVVDKYEGISILPLPQNMGMQHALNMGVWNSQGDKILIINDDNVFPHDWDVRIEAQYDPNIIFTINQIEPTGPGMFKYPVVDCGQTVETFDMEKFLQIEKELATDLITPDGNTFPFLINKKWYMAVGGFDTFYNSPNWCDIDFFTKLELIPTVSYAKMHQVFLYHFGSVATKKNAEADTFRSREHFAMQQFHYKWKFIPNLVESAMQRNNKRLPQDY